MCAKTRRLQPFTVRKQVSGPEWPDISKSCSEWIKESHEKTNDGKPNLQGVREHI